MDTKIIGIANTCKDCPNRHYYSGGAYECMKVKGSRLNEDSSIPAWCPLPNYPAALPSDAAQAPLTDEVRSHLLDAAKLIEKHHPACGYAARAIHTLLAAPVAPAAAAQLSTEAVHKPVHITNIAEHVEGNRTPIDGNQNNAQYKGANA